MAKCKGCGKEIIWAKNENGKMIPLDPRAPVYSIVKDDGDAFRCVRVDGDSDFIDYVTHFATCPKASDFSGSKKK